MAAKASATNHLPDPSGRATTRRWRGPESSGGVVAVRDASRRLLLLASVLHVSLAKSLPTKSGACSAPVGQRRLAREVAHHCDLYDVGAGSN